MGLFTPIVRRYRLNCVRKGILALRALTVADIMSRYVITARPEEEVVRSATRMIAEDISCAVVVEDNKPVGILSERDILKRVPLNKKVFRMKVRDVMRSPLVTVEPHTSLVAAVALMTKHSIRRLVVVEQGKLVGVVTQTDFTRAIAHHLQCYPVTPKLSVAKVMGKQTVMVPMTSTIANAKDLMIKNDIGVVLIVDKMKDPTPVGILTEYDIVMQFYDQEGDLELKDIKDYMRKYVRAVPHDTSVFQANRLMLEKNMRRALVVDGTKVMGMVTQTNICRFIYPNLDLILKAAERPDAQLRRFSIAAEIHGEFHGDHLKVYDID